MGKEKVSKIAKKSKESKTGKQDSATRKKQKVTLFKASPSKLRHLGNYKEFVRHLLSDDVDLEPID